MLQINRIKNLIHGKNIELEVVDREQSGIEAPDVEDELIDDSIVGLL